MRSDVQQESNLALTSQALRVRETIALKQRNGDHSAPNGNPQITRYQSPRLFTVIPRGDQLRPFSFSGVPYSWHMVSNDLPNFLERLP
jgi:hypothetical protein